MKNRTATNGSDKILCVLRSIAIIALFATCVSCFAGVMALGAAASVPSILISVLACSASYTSMLFLNIYNSFRAFTSYDAHISGAILGILTGPLCAWIPIYEACTKIPKLKQELQKQEETLKDILDSYENIVKPLIAP